MGSSFQVLTRSQRVCEARVIGSLMDFIHAPEEPRRLRNLLMDVRTKILSLTITEKGYCMSTDGNLDKSLPAVKQDLQVGPGHHSKNGCAAPLEADKPE